MTVAKSIFKSIFKGYGRGFAGGETTGPDQANLLGYYPNSPIVDGKLIARAPVSSHITQQVKSSGFLGAGSSPCPGLLTTDTITATGDAPTCSVDGTLTFPGPDCWDIDVFRDGVLWASWKGINVGQATELDASGNGHHLVGLVGTAITERLDGSGTNFYNEIGGNVYGSSFRLPRIPCPGGYRLNNGITIDPINSIAGATVTGTGTYSIVTSIMGERAGLLFTQGDGSASRQVIFTKSIAPADLRNTDVISLWIYLSNGNQGIGNCGVAVISFGTAGGFTENAYKSFVGESGWNLLQFAKSSFIKTAGWDWSSLSRIQIRYDTTNSAGYAFMSQLVVGTKSRPKVLLTFDDNDISQVNAAGYANSKGINTTLYAIKTLATDENSGYIKTAGLKTLYDSGNDICGHHETNLTTVPLIDATAKMTEARDWLVASGMTRGSDHFAWPQAAENPELRQAAEEIGYVTAVKGSNTYQPTSLGIPDMFMLCRFIIAGFTLAQIQSGIDNAIAAGKTIILIAHTIGAGKEWSTADWQALCDYIKTKVNAGLLDAVTMSEWYDGLTASSERDLYGNLHGTHSSLSQPGPLGIDGPFDGTAFPTGNFQAPLGADFQLIPEFTGNASVDLETLEPTAKIRIGPRGMIVRSVDGSAEGQARDDRVVGA